MQRSLYTPAESDSALIRSLYQTINALATAVAERDLYTSAHQHSVSAMARLLAQRLGLSDDICNGIRVAGTLHDIGKIAVPRTILNKQDKLTPSEVALIRTHSDIGYRILEQVDFPWPVAEAVRQHHERLDGSGYPRGLVSDDIILEARVISVADTIESMLSDRPYRQGLPVTRVEQELESLSGVTLDADVVAVGLRLLQERRKALCALFETSTTPASLAEIWESE